MARPPSQIDPGPTYVYHLYCEHGGMLYVGVATDLDRRLRQHKRTKPWWREVETIVAQQYSTREEALAVEAFAIHHDYPVENIRGFHGSVTPCAIAGPCPVPGSFQLRHPSEVR